MKMQLEPGLAEVTAPPCGAWGSSSTREAMDRAGVCTDQLLGAGHAKARTAAKLGKILLLRILDLTIGGSSATVDASGGSDGLGVAGCPSSPRTHDIASKHTIQSSSVSRARWFVPSDEAALPKHPRGRFGGRDNSCWLFVLICLMCIMRVSASPTEAAAAGTAWAVGTGVAAAATWGKLLRRPGRRTQRAKKSVCKGIDEREADSALYANITEWGPQARRYITSEEVGLEAAGKWSVVGIAEHHLGKDDTHKMRAAFGVSGYRGVIAPAPLTGRSDKGTHGGVGAFVPKRHAATVADPTDKNRGDAPPM